MNKNHLGLALMLLSVPLAGELKFFPFEGDFHHFRVSFGSPAFLFFLLWLRCLPFTLSGLLTGSAVLLFRLALDVFGGADPSVSFLSHIPAFFYYLAYASIFQFARAAASYDRPLRMAALAVSAEIGASIVELILSLSHASAASIFTLPILGEILIAAVIRSFFVLSFFFLMDLRRTEFVAEQQREQNKSMLLVISGLYEEVIQLQKSMQNAEDITRDCYNLYRNLQNNQTLFNRNEFAQNILEIAGQVHEIKKDNQRIYASLSQLISDGRLTDYLPAAELAELIVQSQQKYARSLSKLITFQLSVADELPPLHVYTVLSLANNLVANSVEAIADVGLVEIVFARADSEIELRVRDSGPGIPAKKQSLVFRPGYTTKFDHSGTPSTGMGLPYIKDLVQNLHGTIRLETPPDKIGASFTIRLPLHHLTKEE